MSIRRDIPPEIKPVEIKSIPEADLFYLDNGIPVYIIKAGTEELMRAEFVFDAGQVREEIPLVASTTNSMLLEGSLNYAAKEINSEFDYYGAFTNLQIQKDSAGMVVFFLNKYIRKIIELSAEVLFSPSFPEDELNNLQKKRLQIFLTNRQKVQNLANDKFFESVFGNSHPYGKQISESDFSNVEIPMMQRFHKEHYIPGNLTIIVSGNIHPETKEILNHFLGKKPAGLKSTETRMPGVSGITEKKWLISKDDALQSAIRIGSTTISKTHADFNGLLVVDTILGGYFGSRLMKNIREDKGYTYGINSTVMPLQQSGYKIIATDVGKKYTRETLDEIYKEIRLLQTLPVELNELSIAKSYMAGEMVRMFDGPFSLAESFRSIWEFGLDNSYYYNLAEKIRTIDPDEIIELTRTYYNIDDLYEIISGPK